MTIVTKTKQKDFIAQEMDWLLDVIKWRWGKEFLSFEPDVDMPKAPLYDSNFSPYEKLIGNYDLDVKQRLVTALALAPFFIPHDLHDAVLSSEKASSLTFGQRKGIGSDLFIPTGTTAIFLLAGNDFEEKLGELELLLNHPLISDKLISLGERGEAEPMGSGFLSATKSLYQTLNGKPKVSFNDKILR